MWISPRRVWFVRPSLYRKGLIAVILAVAGLWVGVRAPAAQELTQHFGRKQIEKGPRALGLVQLSSTGKARLIPIVIMLDGKFYDAGSFKAAPVPMALEYGVVYEGFRTGVSQGLFTITQPGQLNQNWIAEGSWLPAGTKVPQKTKKYSPPVIDDDDSKSDRPVLHRRKGSDADKDESNPTSSTPAPSTSNGGGSAQPPNISSTSSGSSAPSAGGNSTSTSTSTNSPTSTTPPSASTSANPASAGGTSASGSKDASKDSKASTTAASRNSDHDVPFNDPNRPILRRGKPDPNAHHEPFVNFDTTEESANTAGATAKATKDATATIQTVAAISDAGGPDPRPYTYEVKPAEEAIYRNKMFELAGTLLKLPQQSAAAHASSNGTAKTGASAGTAKAGASPQKKQSAQAKLQFEDASLRIFDLSNSNEPVLVLSARTPLPPTGAAGSQVPQEITLVARTNLEGELQKLFFAQTDSHHLDVSPRMELIDAVDADGDGRGELLFRQTSDAGSAYAIYRVTADQLWPLYEGTP